MADLFGKPGRPSLMLSIEIGVGMTRWAIENERKRLKAKLSDTTSLMGNKEGKPVTYKAALAYLNELDEAGYDVVPHSDEHIQPDDPRLQEEEHKNAAIGSTPSRKPDENDLRRYREQLYTWYVKPENQDYVPTNERDVADLKLACEEAAAVLQEQSAAAQKLGDAMDAMKAVVPK